MLAQIQSEIYPGTPSSLEGENGVAWAKVRPRWPTCFVLSFADFRNRSRRFTLRLRPCETILRGCLKMISWLFPVVSLDTKRIVVTTLSLRYADLAVYLDTTKHIQHHDTDTFLRELKEYTATHPLAPSPWPLICSVKIKCNSKALQNGTILVDLPGENDANAARQSIGKKYMEHAENFWIVTPISRAVDDSSTQGKLSIARNSPFCLELSL